MTRNPLVAGNWKMHKTTQEAEAFLDALLATVVPRTSVEIAVFPPFTALERSVRLVAGSDIAVGAQNVHPEPQGAFTGEISCSMLAAAGCRYVLIGHSERRHIFGESETFLREKLAAVLDHVGLDPVLCVGETLEERRGEAAQERVLAQLETALAGRQADAIGAMIVAYEPVWAIGTGETATPEDAQEACSWIRGFLAERFGADVASSTRILYGGSVKPANAEALLSQPDIDGALVGGASLDPEAFAAIVAATPSA
jgi:triosephosphate isomerase